MNTEEVNSSSPSDPLRPGLAYLIYSALFCLYLFWAGSPWPHVDDPFFAGGAVRLAQTGVLTNPWVMDSFPDFNPHHFYLHWPVYFFLLAGWLKMTGIHTTSICIFYLLSNFILCVSSATVFLRLGLPRIILWPLPILCLGYAAVLGFRPDSVALSTFFAGLALWCGRSAISWFFGALLVGNGVAMHSVLCPYALGLGGLLCFLPHRLSFLEIRNRLLICIAAASTMLLLITWMIQGDWFAFLADYAKCVNLRRAHSWNQITYPIMLLLARQDPGFLIALTFLLLWSSLRISRYPHYLPPSLKSLTLTLWLSTLAAALVYYSATRLFLFFMTVWALIWIASEWPRARQPTKYIYVLLAMLTFVEIKTAFQAFRPIHIVLPSGPDFSPTKRIVFDEFSFRYLMDCQPPETARAWLYLNPQTFGTEIGDKKPEDVWIVDAQKIQNAESHPPRAEILIFP